MQTPTNLNEYYTSKGQALPSVQERQSIASTYGINNYVGSAEQNQTLLSSLMSGTQSGTTTPSTSSASTTTTPAPGPASAGDFLKTIQDKLFEQSGALSSSDTNLESKIRSIFDTSKQKITEGTQAGADLATLQYNKQIEDVKTAGAEQLASTQESQRGYGMNTAVLKAVTDATTKKVNDLEQRKQELILQGKASEAQAISGLIMKELEFEQTTRQQAFSNILNLGNFAQKAYEQEQNNKAENQLKASDIETFTDEGGNVVAKNKITGKTMWTSKGIGRSGSASPNIQVTPIADPVTGNVKYIQQKDNSGNILFLDAQTGKKVDSATVKIGESKSPIDIMIDDIMNDTLNGLGSTGF